MRFRAHLVKCATLSATTWSLGPLVAGLFLWRWKDRPVTWAELIVGAIIATVIAFLIDRRLRRGHDNDDPEEGLDL